MKYALILAILVIAGCNVSDDPPLVKPPNNTSTNNTSTNNTATNNTATNNTSTNNTSTNNTSTNNNTDPCDACTEDQVCFEEACCTPAAVDSCGTQCGMIDDGCGGTIDCSCGGATDVCVDGQCCTPMTPEMCTDEQCGMVADGCGGMVDCGVCTCTTTNFETFCPTRACEVVTGCVNEECVYAPLSCNGQACECPAGGCDPDSLTDCRDPGALSCPAQFCDPSPSTDANGNTVFANVCVQPAGAICDFTNLCAQGACDGSTCEEAPCGLCNLGHWDCDAAAANAPTCYDIPPTSVDAAATNCNDNNVASTFIYLDHIAGLDAAGSGSRAQPFKTIGAAVTAAQTRGAKGIIIRDGLVLTSMVELQNGISLYGGYSGAPDWKPVTNGTLQINVASALPNGNVVAVRAANITERTVLHRVRVTSGNATAQGSSTYGIHAFNSPGLVLSESFVQSGNGPNGTNGTSGAAGRNGGTGAAGNNGTTSIGGAGGAAGTNVGCTVANGGAGGRGGYNNANGVAGTTAGGAGGAGGTSTSFGGGTPTAGGNGSPSILLLLIGFNGAGGLANYTITNQFFVNNGAGANGTNGSNGSGGGGGGGGGGGQTFSGFNIQNHGGGGGGGGGAGGCGGTRGTGGEPGGSTFGLFAINSTGLQVIDSTILSGSGGRGGSGGVGGNGGSAGAGGGRGTGSSVAANGGLGGSGQGGTRGGHGGGGAGGVSVGIYCESSQIAPTGSTVTAGARGAGGVSSGTDGEPGFSANLHNCN